MNVKKFQVLRIGIFVAAIGLITLGTFTGLQWKEQRDFIKNSQLYEDATHGFRLRYPSTWDLIPETDLDYRNEQFVVGVYIISEPSTAVGVIVKEKAAQDVVDDAELLQDIEENFSAKYTDFKKISSKKIDHNSYQELDLGFTYQRSDKVSVRQRQRIFITQEKIYFISGSILLVNYPQRQEDLEHIIESFQIMESSWALSR